MPTRFNSTGNDRFFVPGLKSGYEGKPAPSELSIPPAGIADVDAALFHLFDKEIPFQVNTGDKSVQELKKVPVVFASAEKWALSKRSSGLRDKNGSLILPLITVVRTSIEQSGDSDIAGRGINQQTGEIVVRRRLDKSDREYQGLINRLFLKHQMNLAVPSDSADIDQLVTERSVGDLSDDPTVMDGGLLASNNKNNVYETITIPSPQFFTATYDVTFWTQYTVQMFQMIELLIASFLPQGNAWRLDTSKGYWYVATVDGNTYNSENNTDDMSQEERILKHKFTVKVPGYILASAVPGAPVPIKRYISSPIITFDVGLNTNEMEESLGVSDPFLGSDDPTLPMSENQNKRPDQRQVNDTKLYPNKNQISQQDPALASLPRGTKPSRYKKITSVNKNGKTITKFVRITTTNRYSGETVYGSDFDFGGLTISITDD